MTNISDKVIPVTGTVRSGSDQQKKTALPACLVIGNPRGQTPVEQLPVDSYTAVKTVVIILTGARLHWAW